MGMADLVPGVSGGTIAFIAGIYDPLLNSLSALSGEGLACVLRGEFKLAWKAINGPFLLALGVGILTAVVTLAAPLHWLLEHQPIMLRAFFTGLVAASVPLVGRHLSPWNAQAWVWAAVGCAVAGFVTSLPPLVQSTSALWLMGSGMLAICAMLLPGISGSFLLLILGAYAPVLSAIKSLDVAKIAAFGVGAVLGLLAFSRGLKWLLATHRRPALATLTVVAAGPAASHLGAAAHPCHHRHLPACRAASRPVRDLRSCAGARSQLPARTPRMARRNRRAPGSPAPGDRSDS